MNFFKKVKIKNIKKPKKEDIYISILKFAKKEGFEGLDYNNIYQLAKDKGYLSKEELCEIKKYEIDRLNGISDITESKKIKLDAMWNEIMSVNSNKGSNQNRIMSFESYFKLIEHEELSEARRNAKIASWLAMTAIIISVFSVIVSSKPIEFKSPIKIDNQQLEEIQNSKADIKNLENKLNIIINNQEESIKLNKKNSTFLEEIK